MPSLASSSRSSLTLQAVGSRTWFVSFARSSILTFLQRAVTHGHLRIEEADLKHCYGQHIEAGSAVTLRILSGNFWKRVFLSGDLGFSEAYMTGEVEVDDLKAVMDLWLDNQSEFTGLTSTMGRISAAISGLSNAIFGQTRSQARLNAISSYDQSNELFKAFLSKEMMYSCALWGEPEGGVHGDLISGPTANDLEAAQLRKIQHVLRKARVRPGHRLLEFGSGWGSLAIEAARSFGCEVDSLTLSVEQKTLAEERIKEAGLQSRVRVHLLDYRDIPAEFEKAFDAFISIEMLEHVGSQVWDMIGPAPTVLKILPQHYRTFFKLVDFALKAKHAAVVVTSSTFPESRYSRYQAEDFMRKYMWPNSCLPSATTLIKAAHSASHGSLALEGVENHAAHYPRTLRTWARRLEANLRQGVMAERYPALNDPTEFAVFKRKWEYLFVYAGAGFSKGYIACHMLTFIRANDVPEDYC